MQRLMAILSPRQWEVIVALAAPLLIGCTLLAGEIALRIEQYRQFGHTALVEATIDQMYWDVVGDRRRPRPNTAMGRIHFSDQGFRGEAVTMPKPQDVIRIAFLGPSTVLDPYVHDDAQSWPAVTLAHLRKAYPACRFDAINAGVPGYDLRAIEKRFIEDTLGLQPDIAILQGTDMTNRARKHIKARGGDADPYRPSWLARQSYLWQKIEKNIEAQRLLRIAARADLAMRLNFPSMLADLAPETERLLSTAQQHGVLPVLVENAFRQRREQSIDEQLAGGAQRALYMPNVYVADITEAIYAYNTVLRDVATAKATPFIATLDRMPSRPDYYVDTSHTTAAGSAVLGAIVGEGLVANTAIAQLIAERGKGCNAAR